MRITAYYLLTCFLFLFDCVAAQAVSRNLRRRRRRKGLSVSATGTGDQEVPPVVTDTTARLSLKFDAGYTKARYRLFVFDGENITQAHLHCGVAGSNGPVAAVLFNVAPVPGPGGVDVDGHLITDTLTNSNITADCSNIGAGSPNVATLANAILNNELYLNVHTEANPSGEVRAQIFHND